MAKPAINATGYERGIGARFRRDLDRAADRAKRDKEEQEAKRAKYATGNRWDFAGEKKRTTRTEKNYDREREEDGGLQMTVDAAG